MRVPRVAKPQPRAGISERFQRYMWKSQPLLEVTATTPWSFSPALKGRATFIPTVRVESSGTRDGTRRKHRDPRPVANSDGSQVPPDLGLPLGVRRCCRFGALLLHELPHGGNVTG